MEIESQRNLPVPQIKKTRDEKYQRKVKRHKESTQ
jgi:hypothetical protein